MPPSQPPHPTATGKVLDVSRAADRAARAVWRRLCLGTSAPWLEEIWDLRTTGDGFESTLDIWSVALTAALKDADRKEIAATVLARLGRLTDQPTD
jgi:hypothetical protein